MELDANLIALQGVLRDLLNITGEFLKIKYRGGNEMKISQIVNGMKQYLLNTFPDVDDAGYFKQLQNLTLFLTINTKFEDNSLLNKNEYFHLINVIPLLSKCLLANVIVELNLTSHYCSIMPTMSLHLNKELLHEMIPCLKQCEPQQALDDTYIILTKVIKLLCTLNPKEHEEIVESLVDISSEMLTNVSGINPDLIQNWKKPQMHRHIGRTLLYLLKLLLICPLHAQNISRITDNIIRATMKLMEAVTINVFCDWAEVNHDHDQPLQTVIAGSAYLVVEHLQKHKPGKELVQMLGTIARKPKTIKEVVLEADKTTMIYSINKCDNNQKLWFKAFIGTNVLQDEESLNCLEKWSHLCTASDVTRLLMLSISYKEPRIKALVVKCAGSLQLEELSLVTSRYFWECDINNLNTETAKEQLTMILNKTQNSSEADDDFVRKIFLLLLQNPGLVLNTLYTDCLKKTIHTQRLKVTFEKIKTAVAIKHLSKTVFVQVFENHPPTLENIVCYKELLTVLLELEYFQDSLLVNEIFTPQLLSSFHEDNCESLLYALKVLNLTLIRLQLNLEAIPTIALLGNIMDKMRCQFIEFSNVKKEVVEEAVNLMLKYSSRESSPYLQCKDCLDELQLKYPINKLYVSNLYQEQEIALLKYVEPAFDINNHLEVISKLMKLLPSCVTSEWILVTKELESQFGNEKTLNIFYQVLLVLCQLTKTQEKESDGNENIAINGLKFCLQQYGVVIKEVLQPKYTSLEDENCLTKSVCSLLQKIPKGIQKEEGLRLTGLLSDQSLQALKKDRGFILSLIAIGETTVSQSLAQRMLT